MQKTDAKWQRWAPLMICLGLFVGCSGSEPSAEECFRWSTGLDVPPGVTCERSKVITVAFVADTYYIKFQAKENLSEFLGKHFKSSSWDSVRDSMTPPADWMKDLPFWDLAAIRGRTYFGKSYRDGSETTFISALSYDQKSGIVYFVGMECRD